MISSWEPPLAFPIETKVLVPALVSAMLEAGIGAALAFVPLLGLERGIAYPGVYFAAAALRCASIAFAHP